MKVLLCVVVDAGITAKSDRFESSVSGPPASNGSLVDSIMLFVDTFVLAEKLFPTVHHFEISARG